MFAEALPGAEDPADGGIVPEDGQLVLGLEDGVGAGGLGDFAIRYGHDRNMTDITWTTVIVLVIAVSIVQTLGGWIAKKNTH